MNEKNETNIPTQVTPVSLATVFFIIFHHVYSKYEKLSLKKKNLLVILIYVAKPKS
jgi:hypothetical protein